MLVQILFCLVIHLLLHNFQLLSNGGLQLLQLHKDLLPVGTADNDALAVFQIPGTALHPQGHAFHLIFRAFPAHGAVGVVHLHPQAGIHQPVPDGSSPLQNACFMLGNGKHHHLHRRNHRRQNQSVVVAMGHDNAANQPGGHAPGSLERIDLLVIFVGKFNIKSPGKAVAEVVGGAGL